MLRSSGDSALAAGGLVVPRGVTAPIWNGGSLMGPSAASWYACRQQHAPYERQVKLMLSCEPNRRAAWQDGAHLHQW